MKNCGAIIQARMGSTRLPGKVLKKIMGKTMLERVVERVKQARFVDKVIIATTLKKADFEIVNQTNIDHTYDRFIAGEGKYQHLMLVCRKNL